MTEYLKRRIRELEAEEFGPNDPRTSSLNSTSGGALSFENRRKLLEDELRKREVIGAEIERAKERFKDEGFLLRRLGGVIDAYVDACGESERSSAEAGLAVEFGTGSLVMCVETDQGLTPVRFVDADVMGKRFYIYEETPAIERVDPTRLMRMADFSNFEE